MAGEERKLVTILFADLVGSTAHASELDPERVRSQLERFYAAMAEEIELTGGTVEKFSGDGVMAVFGAPAALEDHAERALHAALAMQRRLLGLFDGRLEMRVGVNTGEVVVGSPHEGGSFVTGDAVNVGDRLQRAAEPGGVLAGERTVAAAGSAFEFGEVETVKAKGKPDGVACRPVVRALSVMRPRGADDLDGVFVGRGNELELLRAGYRRAAAGSEAHLVTIVGEPGIGKTRLVRELADALAEDEPGPVWRVGRCLAYGDGITYRPLAEVLREHYGLRERDAPDEILRRLEGREILGLAFDLDVAGDLHPVDARDQLHAAFVGFVDDIATDQPVVLVVEDVHWAEPDLLDLLERVVTESRAGALVLATARPELYDTRPAWGAGSRNTTVVRLDPLPAGEAGRLLDELVPAVLTVELREQLVQRADGNPFFLEELVGELSDVGVLERREDGWVLGGGPAEVTIPDTVHAVLAARIDRLPETEKAALQAGAVVGRAFWAAPVVHLLGGIEPDFALLEERDLIRGRRTSAIEGDREYTTKHALTREVAYGTIPKARRGRLHASLADWLEQSEPGTDERAAQLAYHYSEAVKPEDADLVWSGDPDEHERLRRRAVVWLRRAGDLARGRYEMDEAVELLRRAVDLSDDEHERAVLWRQIGEAQALRYDGEAFWTAMERSLEGPLDTRERAEAYSLLAFQTSIRSGMWAVLPSRELIEGWAAHALELSETGSVERVRSLLARVQAEPGEASEELLDEVTEIASGIADPDLHSWVFGARSSAAFENLRFEEAAAWSERRLALVPDLDNPDSRCEVYEDGAPISAALGRFDEARQFGEEYGELARRLSAHHRLHAVSLKLELCDLTADWTGIADATERTIELVTKNLATPCLRNARDLLLCTAAHVALGNDDDARRLEREADGLAREGHERELAHPRLRIALARGDTTAASSLVQIEPQRRFVWGAATYATLLDALVALQDHARIEREAPPLLQQGAVVEPFALRALGAARGDDGLLVDADARFAALGLEWHRAQTGRLLAWP